MTDTFCSVILLGMSTTDNSVKVIEIVGLIGETSEFFLLPLHNVKELHLDMTKTTFMNSVGVKHWIMWTLKVPKSSKIILKKCPHMIASQASMVTGFLPSHFAIQSFFAPFLCPSCETEHNVELISGVHYQPAAAGVSSWIKLPEMKCPKCKGAENLEPDFFPEKVFSFLNHK